MAHGAAVWRPVVTHPLFYPAVVRAYIEDSVCLELRKYGKLNPEEHQEDLPL